MNEIAQALKNSGLKLTPQRIVIYDVLKNTVEHPTAETIYNTLKPSHPTMSLATVYKTLDSFLNAHLIQELEVGDGRSHYDAWVEPHPHFVCKSCGKVVDMDLEELKNLSSKIPAELGLEIEEEKLIFYGRCKDCK